jgi:lactoylglutathione lyase
LSNHRAEASTFLHVGLDVRDLDRSLGFYSTLGFQEHRRFDLESSTHAFLTIGGPEERLQLSKRLEDDQPAQALGTKHVHLGIAVADIEATVARLEGLGGRPEGPPFRAREDGPLLCFIRDLDGHRIELTQPSRS